MRLNICVPKSSGAQINFNALVANLFERIGLNNAKIQTASSLRDTLLPRLISGQLRLPDAQVNVENAL
jgi:type I restriction enzyme S subunit